jgi:RNA polymerase sigma-70 factor (ECF subfamily)
MLTTSTPAASDALERLGGLVRDQRVALLAVARAQGLSAEEALECVQEALCTWLARERAGIQISDPWALPSLQRMVKNAARNLRRRHFRLKPHRPIDAEHEPAGLGPPADGLLEQAETLVKLQACVAELCAIERSVVMLRLLEERSGEDVAALLGLARGHVDVLVHRARAALRVCMQAPG